MVENFLAVKNLTKEFISGIPVIRDVSFAVKEGTSFGSWERVVLENLSSCNRSEEWRDTSQLMAASYLTSHTVRIAIG
jgi:hypothetical protein